jgi:DMSO/TMAO reductase YedYZ molybdopterin-dependent catalytic subunit
MVQKPLVLTVDDIKAMPSISRVVFIECTGNGWENWKKADPDVTVQNTHGLVSTNEWTGVPLKFLIDLVGKDSGSSWMLAEGGDARRAPILHLANGDERAVPLQRAANLEHRPGRESTQCTRLTRLSRA